MQDGLYVVVHLCCGFSLWRQMAPQESAKIGQFHNSSRKYSVANASIWTLFSTSVRDEIYIVIL